ncbi:hypothetical protein ACHAWF_000237, partial [Thalassiosira exigua]
MPRFNCANMFPKKHVMDNEVSEQMKEMIGDEAVTIETEPRLPIVISRLISSAASMAWPTIYLQTYGISCCPKPRSQSIPCGNSTQRKPCQHMPISMGPSTTTRC